MHTESYIDSVIPCGHVGTGHEKNVMNRLPAVLPALHEINVENSGWRSVEAQGLLTQIDLSFTETLAVFRKIPGDTKLLSDMLQAGVDLIQALQHAEGVQR